MGKTEEMVSLLAKVPLFQGLNNRHLGQIASRLVPRTYLPDQEIVTQGKTGFGMFIIIDGHADAVLELSDGSKTVVNSFRPNDFFGEVSMLDGEARTASVIAREKTECLVLDRVEFLALMHNDAEMATRIAVTLAKRMRRALGSI
jgi:CRP-like cAMP-binding protein